MEKHDKPLGNEQRLDNKGCSGCCGCCGNCHKSYKNSCAESGEKKDKNS